MRFQQQTRGQHASRVTDDVPKDPRMLTRNLTIEHAGVVRNIGDCPLTIRRSVSAWSVAESQQNPYYQNHPHAFQAYDEKGANTPRCHLLSPQSNAENDIALETAHNRRELYADLSVDDAGELRNRPTISLADLNDGVDFEALLYGPLNDEKLKPVHQRSISTADNCRFEQPRPVWHLFNAIASDEVYRKAEDWGIDRSIYTRYARSGFFADCYVADSMHHGEYLSVTDCEEFAECRIPLIVCIISTSRQARQNEVQRGIVPLAVHILDRYIEKHKHSMARLISIAFAHVDGTSSENSSKQASLASSINASDAAALDTAAVAKHLKAKYRHDNLIKLCFNFSPEKTRRENTALDGHTDTFHDFGCHNLDTDSCYEDGSEYDETTQKYNSASVMKADVVYNFVAAACFFIADRYNGLSNTSVKALLVKWESTCLVYTKTRHAGRYIRENRAMALSIIMSFMFDIYFVLEYKLTTPFPCHMVQDLILSTTDFHCSPNPSEYSVYQKIAAIMARIAYVDDTFHKFPPSILTLAIYGVVRRLAVHNEVVEDENAWLLVDESDSEIRRCSSLLINTLIQYVNTDILDVLTQPVYMKHHSDELFGNLFEDLCDLDAGHLRKFASTLMSLT
ncbi:cyclin 2, putative [Babesia ovata]|uniref:Cyclin 2, putative n=1 Tax=Babesia ovata TaxID=189622 RepID=A0A2H6K6S1_9APIC|nr:cyclin 2, putative [Babesia ovata]GBE58697.1 cyclin 2, putative [Babesia ovata]